MKRYNCTLSDKRGAFGLCMEEHKEGMFVPFSEVGPLNQRINQLLEERNATGIAISNAILSGIVQDKHPLRSRLALLGSHHKREQELAAQLSDATRQCGVMADSLRYQREFVTANVWDDEERNLLLEYIDTALTGKLLEPAMPEGWKLVEKANCFTLVSDGQVIASMAGPTAEGTAAILASVLDGKVSRPANQDELVSVSDIASLQRHTIATIGVVDGKDHGAEMEEDDEGEYVLLADALMLAADKKPEHAA